MRRAWIGPQSEINTEDVAVGRALLHEANEIAGHADENGASFQAIAQTDAVAVVENDQIDIAGVVQFVGAIFAHANDDVA